MKSGSASKIRPHRPVTMMKFKFILCRYELFEFYIDQKEELEAELWFLQLLSAFLGGSVRSVVAEVLFLPSYWQGWATHCRRRSVSARLSLAARWGRSCIAVYRGHIWAFTSKNMLESIDMLEMTGWMTTGSTVMKQNGSTFNGWMVEDSSVTASGKQRAPEVDHWRSWHAIATSWSWF